MPEHAQFLRSNLSRYREHLSGYQRRDYEVVDYQMQELPGTRLQFRGPFPQDLTSGRYFTCLGAAQTLGCFCEKPYPELLSQVLGLPALNLGYGGAGPEFFERHDCLDNFINGGAFVVIQVMSGRSQSNSLFDCRGLEYLVRRKDGSTLSADSAYRDLLFGVPAFSGDSVAADLKQRAMRKLFPRLGLPTLLARSHARSVVQETRKGWVESYKRLLARISVPVVLLWFSKRTPAYVEDWGSVSGLFGEFPQLVNDQMVNEIKPLCEHYIECVTSAGSPQPLVSRFSGEPVSVDPQLDRPDLRGARPWTHNVYYPSPEMHQAAVRALAETCKPYSEVRQAV